MNIVKYISALGIVAATALTSCIEEYDPQASYANIDQVQTSPTSFQSVVEALCAPLSGEFTYAGSSNMNANDFGYTSFYLERDVMGQDILPAYMNWWQGWYGCIYLGASNGYPQYALTCYYKWIKNCNTVIEFAGDEPTEDKYSGLGQAYAMRALLYLDVAQMYGENPSDPDALSCVFHKEFETIQEAQHNPRKTNRQMYAQIISDLDQAEYYLADYVRPDVYTPDLSVVYGLKARTYLLAQDWANAEKYAKMAQEGYAMMTSEQYTDRNLGFNTPNGAWMLATRFQSTDPCIQLNDADSSWGSMMSIEINPYVSGCGYASNYGQPMLIDRHLYETIPSTDARKMCYIDFAIDELDTEEEMIEALSAYSDYPEWILYTGYYSSSDGSFEGVGGLPLKFRVAGGAEGHNNQYIGFLQSVPMMRVEEMMLIEAEAAGMQDESRGIALLTTFATNRDPEYTYGTHNEAYYNTSTSAFQNEIWWQRRVELWGEGFATYDIKRLRKGIIRSYDGTNHVKDYRWNVETTPQWMVWVYCQTESNYNYDLVNNPNPVAPICDSPEYVW